MDVVRSVNVHDDIKDRSHPRQVHPENYKQCIAICPGFGVRVICYNFMPVFDWTRTDLFHPVGDGSTALFYEGQVKDDYKAMAGTSCLHWKYNMTFPAGSRSVAKAG